MNYLIDLNIIFDYYNDKRRELFPHSVEIIENLLNDNSNNAYISSSSIDNLEFTKAQELKRIFGFASKIVLEEFIKDIISKFKIAKTPSYIDIDYEDIEDSQIVASAKAVNAKVITRDKGMLKKYSNIAITPQYFLENKKKMNIDFANLKKQYFMYQPELEEEIDKVLNNSSYIMGSAVTDLEENLQNFTGAKHAITCSSGTDALLLAMMALDIQPDDEIITTPFTFIATAESIAFLKAKPVFVDIDEKTYNLDISKIEEKITDKTKAIIAVSLYGQPCDIDALEQLKIKHSKLKIIIDGAQSFGSTFNGKTDSTLGDISTTSFFPAKPLGCFGDGGAVFTNDDELASKIKQLRVHGQDKRYHHKYIGLGGRMDTIQCAIVDVKLKHYKKDLALRQEVAEKYTKRLRTGGFSPKKILPFIDNRATSAFAQYSVRVKNRDEVQAKLKEAGIPTAVHYPMPLHLQECFAYLGYKEGDFPVAEKVSNEIMSLPMNPYISDAEIEYICKRL
jgi:UDP-2-acetamido-2-deoxy-ribo-hexuluronate aminotransferase